MSYKALVRCAATILGSTLGLTALMTSGCSRSYVDRKAVDYGVNGNLAWVQLDDGHRVSVREGKPMASDVFALWRRGDTIRLCAISRTLNSGTYRLTDIARAQDEDLIFVDTHPDWYILNFVHCSDYFEDPHIGHSLLKWLPRR